MIVNVNHVNKSIAHKEIIHALSFTLNEGKIYCLMGPNGVGKTTTIRLLLGLLAPDSGGITVFDQHPHGNTFSKVKMRIGVMNDGSTYERLSVQQNLNFWRSLYSQHMSEEQLNHYLKELDLDTVINQPVGTLSKGNKQKVLFLRAILNDPELLILDEPTVGLDPAASDYILGIIEKMAHQEGKTVFLSTHQLYGMDKIADEVFLMNQGTIKLAGTPQELIRQFWPELKVRIKFAENKAIGELLNALPYKNDWQSGNSECQFILSSSEQIPEIITFLVGNGVKIYSVTSISPSLHDLYKRYFKESEEKQHE